MFEVTATIYFSVIETLSKSPFQVPTENEPRGVSLASSQEEKVTLQSAKMRQPTE